MELLQRLSDEFKTGREMAGDLGVSRAAVSKAARRLIEEGFPLEVHPRRGYRLRPGSPTPQALHRLLPQGVRFGRAYRYLGTCGSTQDELRAWAEAGAPEGAVVLAERQTAGRGRHGRRWESTSGNSLTFSLLVRATALPIARIPVLSLAAGVAVSRLSAPSSLKWPNDVLVKGKKLAGILIESKITAEQPEYVLVGVGLNVHRPVPAGGVALEEIEPEPTRVRVLADLLAHLEAACRLASAEPEAVIAEWKNRTDMLGRRVRANTPSGTVSGTADNLDATGGLIVATDDGPRTVHAGDVTILRMEGDGR